jgi:putative transposase
MHRIYKPHMKFLFAGSRMLQGPLVQDGFKVGRPHVATLMKRVVVEALYRNPYISKPAPEHNKYPYPLPKLRIIRPDQVWAMDITYIALLADCSAIACRAMDGARVHPSGSRA